MNKEFWEKLETRLLDIYQSQPTVRYLLTSSAKSIKKHKFSQFLKDKEIKRIQ